MPPSMYVPQAWLSLPVKRSGSLLVLTFCEHEWCQCENFATAICLVKCDTDICSQSTKRVITCSKFPSRLEISNTIVSVSQPPVSKMVELLTFHIYNESDGSMKTSFYLNCAVVKPFMLQSEDQPVFVFQIRDQMIIFKTWGQTIIFNREELCREGRNGASN